MAYTATYRNEGVRMDYTPGAAVSAGDVVVVGDLVGVATRDIAANALGALNINEVFRFPKTAGTGEAIAQGKIVYWDATNEVMTETSTSNQKAGITVAAAAADDETVDVLLCPGIE